jgi:hypothetical protein
MEMGDFVAPPPNMAPVAIYSDGGGLVDVYREAAIRYRLEGRQVKILGSCRSACIMALSVPNVCVGPDAVVKAHHAYEPTTKVLRPDVTAQMMVDLPHSIRARVEPNITREYNSKTTLFYNDLLALGIPDCNSIKSREPIRPAFHKVKTVRVVAQSRDQSHKISYATNPVASVFNAIGRAFK